MDFDAIPLRNIKAVFSDLDDTLTIDSRLPAETYDNLWKLHEKGTWLVIVSGRPAGWADCLMRLFPIDAMVFENGAGVILREGDALTAKHFAGQREIAKLEATFKKIQAQFPKAKLASDQPYRIYDYAIDFNEEPPRLTSQEVQSMLATLEKEPGITAKLSSIHINYWAGQHTKVTACRWLIENEGKKKNIKEDEILFAGDSPNDAPLFEAFPWSVGVANIQPYLDQITHKPKVITTHPGAKGFNQLATQLLSV